RVDNRARGVENTFSVGDDAPWACVRCCGRRTAAGTAGWPLTCDDVSEGPVETCGGKKAVARESDKSPESGTEPLGPVAALRRIAFLLERRLAETYKVKAFRSAAATLLPLGDRKSGV